jgi:hypothetical protein
MGGNRTHHHTKQPPQLKNPTLHIVLMVIKSTVFVPILLMISSLQSYNPSSHKPSCQFASARITSQWIDRRNSRSTSCFTFGKSIIHQEDEIKGYFPPPPQIDFFCSSNTLIGSLCFSISCWVSHQPILHISFWHQLLAFSCRYQPLFKVFHDAR